jgi:membrane-associated protease RseP (regulator of RpoE activity)
MHNSLWIIAIVIVSSFASGCASTSLYQSWGKQLTEMSRHYGRLDDVSLLLGTPPTRCEPVASPRLTIGAYFDKLVVISVMPNGPAYLAGIRPGDSIISIDNQQISGYAQFRATVQSVGRAGEPLNIETSRGTVAVAPKLPKAELCYWDIQAGQVARGGAFVNQYGGAASSGGYQRFFRASCEIYDGFLSRCQFNWQE